jgi:hypothetical protein
VKLDWIKAYGSDRLMRLVKEGFEFGAVCRDERMAVDRPGWRLEPDNMKLEEPRNPPDWALEMLDEARKTVPGAKLKYFELTGDESGEEYVTHGYVVSDRFLGRSIIFAFAYPDDSDNG